MGAIVVYCDVYFSRHNKQKRPGVCTRYASPGLRIIHRSEYHTQLAKMSFDKSSISQLEWFSFFIIINNLGNIRLFYEWLSTRYLYSYHLLLRSLWLSTLCSLIVLNICVYILRCPARPPPPDPSCSNAPPKIKICQSSKHYQPADITSLYF